MTTAFVPQEATYNPVTYLLGTLRALIQVGRAWDEIGRGLAAVAGVGLISMPLAFASLRGRVSRG